MIELLGDRKDFNIITKNHIFINMKIILTEEQFNRVILKEDDKPKHSITKKKNSKKGKDSLFKKLSKIFKKKNPIQQIDKWHKKYGNGLPEVSWEGDVETYTYLSNEMKGRDEASSEVIFLKISNSVETRPDHYDWWEGKKLTKRKSDVSNIKINRVTITLNHNDGYETNTYSYFDAKFYSNNKHLDTISSVRIGYDTFPCSVSTLDGITGNCEPPKEMINIIKEKLLPTEYGNEIKSNLQNIGISI